MSIREILGFAFLNAKHNFRCHVFTVSITNRPFQQRTEKNNITFMLFFLKWGYMFVNIICEAIQWLFSWDLKNFFLQWTVILHIKYKNALRFKVLRKRQNDTNKTVFVSELIKHVCWVLLLLLFSCLFPFNVIVDQWSNISFSLDNETI